MPMRLHAMNGVESISCPQWGKSGDWAPYEPQVIDLIRCVLLFPRVGRTFDLQSYGPGKVN